MGKRVLLADDSATIQKLVKMALSGTSYELHSAFDGREALKKTNEVAPDIILADAIMPDMDGYELCQAVKADPRLSGVPVVLLIGRFQPFDEARAEAAGIDERMIKPFSASRLIELIEKLLANAPEKPVMPPEPDGGMDATVNMTPEELATHTSQWQNEQTAMTEDIPKIEDIQFDDDISFDDDPVTSDLSQADTMMLDERLEDGEDDADVGGPMTMELSTEDLVDIDDPVPSFSEAEEVANQEQFLAEDDVEELDESDLLDDSIGGFEIETEEESQNVPLEELDTGPLQPVAAPASLKEESTATDFDEGDTQPVEPPDLSAVPQFDEIEDLDDQLDPSDAITEDFVKPEETIWGDETIAAAEMVNLQSPSEPITSLGGSGYKATPQEIVSGPVMPESDSDLDATVSVTDGWQPSQPVPEPTPVAPENLVENAAPAEPLIEVDEELPLEEESLLDQDSLLEVGDYEPLGSAIEEPLADALLMEESKSDLDSGDPLPVAQVEEDLQIESPTVEEVSLERETVLEDDVQFESAPDPEGDVETESLEVSNEAVQELSSASDEPLEPDAFEEVLEDQPDALLEDDETEIVDATEVDVLEPDTMPIETPVVPEPVVAEEPAQPEPVLEEIVPGVAAAATAATAAVMATAHDGDTGAAEGKEEEPVVATAASQAVMSEDLLNQLADKVAERVMRKFERDTIREIAWEVIPELSEAIIKRRIFELERAADQD